jgi:ribonuclease Z
LSIEIKILGANAAAPAHHRNQTSQIVKINSQVMMVDCGESTQIQMKRFGERMSQLSQIFISHLHGDHYYGLMGLLSTMHLYGRKVPIHIYGPKGLLEIITLQQYYAGNNLNFEIEFHEWKEGVSEVLFENDHFTVTGLPLDHRIPCMGFLFQEKPKKHRINKAALKNQIPPNHINTLKNGLDVLDNEGNVLYSKEEFTLPPRPSFSYAYCSDTKYKPDLIPTIAGVDLLYHEATFTEEYLDRAEATHHSTAKQAAMMAFDAKVGKLIIGHYSNRYKDLSPLLDEAKGVFDNVVLAIEGENHIVE